MTNEKKTDSLNEIRNLIKTLKDDNEDDDFQPNVRELSLALLNFDNDKTMFEDDENKSFKFSKDYLELAKRHIKNEEAD